MNRLQFSIAIKAEDTTIWEVLWNKSSYRKWASIFFEGSHVVADNWDKGSKVLFLDPDQNGIYSSIKKHIPNKIIEFKHIGNVVKGKEQAIDNKTKKWSGATEIYSIAEGTHHNDQYTLTIEIDILDEHLDFMTEKLPKAMERIKQLSEQHSIT